MPGIERFQTDNVALADEPLKILAERLAPNLDAVRSSGGEPEVVILTARRSPLTGVLLLSLFVFAVSPAALLLFPLVRDHLPHDTTLRLATEKAGVALSALSPVLKAPESIQVKGPKASNSILLTLPNPIVARAQAETELRLQVDAMELPSGSELEIAGFPTGTAFSAGRAWGEAGWRLSIEEAARARISLPQTAKGEYDLVVEVVTGGGTRLAKYGTVLSVVQTVDDDLVRHPEDVERITDLIAHGQKMVAVGYVAGARAYFKRAAEAGSGEAALALSTTYERNFIDEIGARGIRPDPREAQIWLRRAQALGVEADKVNALALARGAAESSAPYHPVSSSVARPQREAPKDVSGEDGDASNSPPPMLVSTDGEDTWVEPTGAAHLRSLPSPNGESLKVVRNGTKLRVLTEEGVWLRVHDPHSGEIGWIYKNALANE